jgi:adenylate kinase family enzyme
MSLFFITGIAGSGKSTVQKELKSRGYEAYDTDDDGFAKWHNNETGYIHPKSSVKNEDRTKEFLKIHSWKVPRQEVEDLASRAKGKTIFLCGVAANEDEIRDLFKAVFELTIDDETLIHRLTTRTNNDWGKQPHELQQTLESQHNIDELYRKHNPILIDATQPIEVVVDNIIAKINV